VRRRRILIVLAACVLVGIGVVAFWPGEQEPEYEGCKLSEWLETYQYSYSEITVNRQIVAAEAIRRIGTNGIPWLVKWLCYEEPPWKKHLYVLRDKLPGTFRRSFLGHWMFNMEVEPKRRRSGARIGIRILGANASGAVPGLCVLARNPDQIKSLMAFELLEAIGDPAVPALNRLTDDPDARVSADAFRTLGCIRFQGALKTLESTQGLRFEPAKAIPAHTNGVKDF
jgi:hypothetical protein